MVYNLECFKVMFNWLDVEEDKRFEMEWGVLVYIRRVVIEREYMCWGYE